MSQRPIRFLEHDGTLVDVENINIVEADNVNPILGEFFMLEIQLANGVTKKMKCTNTHRILVAGKESDELNWVQISSLIDDKPVGQVVEPVVESGRRPWPLCDYYQK